MATTPFVDPQTIHTPSTGTVPPASWGTALRNDLVTLATPPGCTAQRTTAQTIVNGTISAIAFTAADLRDTDAYHDTVTNNTRLTVPAGLGGLYQVFYNVGFASNATAYRQAQVNKNGVVASPSLCAIVPAVSGQVQWFSGAGLILMNATDYLELAVVQTTGGNLNTDTNFPVVMGMYLVGVS